jgi:hypothetical protein
MLTFILLRGHDEQALTLGCVFQQVGQYREDGALRAHQARLLSWRAMELLETGSTASSPRSDAPIRMSGQSAGKWMFNL